jgi:excisionase family DNA binding protein
MTNKPQPRLLGLREAAAYLGVSYSTVYELIGAGDLPAVRPHRLRRIWVDRVDLDRWVERCKEGGTGQ